MNTYTGLRVALVALVAIGAGGCAGKQGVTSSASVSPSMPPSTTSRPTPSPVASPALTQTFTSTLHGISVSYPGGWTAEAATQPWSDRTFPLSFGVAQADFLYDPTLTDRLFLTFASQPIRDSTPEAWIAEQMASDEGCPASQPIVVGGAT